MEGMKILLNEVAGRPYGFHDFTFLRPWKIIDVSLHHWEVTF